jgi:hypothetical protein
MKRFALIENNEVQKIEELPINWKNISNFYILNPDNPEELEVIKQNGWLPVETITDDKPVYVQTEYVIEDYCVKEIIITRDKTPEEIEEDNRAQINTEWALVRSKRNNLLTESDSDVVSDKWEIMSPEDKVAISTYRQNLRNIPQTFSTPGDVIWPVKP